MVDSGPQCEIAWSDIVTLALTRLENVEPVAANRLAANYNRRDRPGPLRSQRAA